MTCPTGALRERSALKNVWTAISDPGKKVAAVVSPAAKVGLFRAREPQTVDGLLVGALKTLGFDYVFDMSIANRLYLELLALEVKERKAGADLLSFPPFVLPLWLLWKSGILSFAVCQRGKVPWSDCRDPCQALPRAKRRPQPKGPFRSRDQTMYRSQRRSEPNWFSSKRLSAGRWSAHHKRA